MTLVNFKSSFGQVYLIFINNKLTSIKFDEEKDNSSSDVSNLDNLSKSDSIIKKALIELKLYFNGELTNLNIPFILDVTDFQKRVLMETLKIPYGKTATYGDIAKLLGGIKYSRAVGMALNKNPLPIIIPCHRVIGKNNNLTGFAYGIELKSKLIHLEHRYSTQHICPMSI